jgi:hypothetical protein
VVQCRRSMGHGGFTARTGGEEDGFLTGDAVEKAAEMKS